MFESVALTGFNMAKAGLIDILDQLVGFTISNVTRQGENAANKMPVDILLICSNNNWKLYNSKYIQKLQLIYVYKSDKKQPT